jgi:hypothetical protein
MVGMNVYTWCELGMMTGDGTNMAHGIIRDNTFSRFILEVLHEYRDTISRTQSLIVRAPFPVEDTRVPYRPLLWPGLDYKIWRYIHNILGVGFIPYVGSPKRRNRVEIAAKILDTFICETDAEGFIIDDWPAESIQALEIYHGLANEYTIPWWGEQFKYGEKFGQERHNTQQYDTCTLNANFDSFMPRIKEFAPLPVGPDHMLVLAKGRRLGTNNSNFHSEPLSSYSNFYRHSFLMNQATQAMEVGFTSVAVPYQYLTEELIEQLEEL